MTYTVLARKYRPQTFEDLVGQEHVARTLANAIEANRVAHAFLFTGVRGVGKTTTARLLAKALNCDLGPTGTPCNECDPCKEITAGVDMDVQEMDGASNNSVDDVRRLQESIPYRPARDRFKVVIVDEVHMLSAGAFNAFLKTLEEPPSHVKFIFATTESHKVPITIRSRCQCYDFRLIPQQVIGDRVRAILGEEGIEADDAAVSIVAREAAGSMRDALTLLDQIVAFGGDSLRGEEVARTLGIAGREAILMAAKATLSGDGADVLRGVEKIATQGVDMLHFARQLLDYLRELTVLRVTDGDAGTLSGLVAEEREEAMAIAKSTDMLELQRAFAALSQLVEDVGRSGSPRTVLEMGLLRIATRPPLKQVGELLARLDAIEKSFGGGGSGGGGGRGQGRRPSQGGQGGHGSHDRRPSGPSRRMQDAGPQQERSRNEGRNASRGSSDGAPPAAANERTAPAMTGRSPEPSAEVAPERKSEPARREAPESSASPREADEPPVAASPPAAKAAPNGDLLATWEQIVGHLREARPALAAILEHGVPQEIDGEKIVVGFPTGSFFGKQAEARESKEGIASSAEQVLGALPEVIIRFIDEPEALGQTVAEASAQERNVRIEERRREALRHPRVQEALQVFPEGAGNVKVQVELD
ncbi:MAG: DNA polymerase III subunit gamma/tau [Deltaproteobacteria bacterium]|nr:DNA polymerase III subunit gamma/tau [Deltaproteobacteria bacterium]